MHHYLSYGCVDGDEHEIVNNIFNFRLVVRLFSYGICLQQLWTRVYL